MASAMNADKVTTNPTGALGLLLSPYTFVQDQLLRTDEFLSIAGKRGNSLNRASLQRLHGAGLLVPFFRISREAVAGRQLAVTPDGNFSTRREALNAAASGRLRDSGDEGYSAAWPYSRPPESTALRWRDDFLFSSWQLIDAHEIVNDVRWLDIGLPVAELQLKAQRRRSRAIAIAALTPRYLSSIVGKLSVPSGMDAQALLSHEFETEVTDLLTAAAIRPEELRPMAEELLLDAGFRDPIRDWLPIIRHASYNAWSKLRGEALDCLWQRIGAEVLLRAHDDLAEAGILAPLPDVTQYQARHPLHDRLGRQAPTPDSLDESLVQFGLSPYPRVLLLVEGETELIHFPLLLATIGLGRDNLVRVQQATGASIDPKLLARYAISPRLGKRLYDGSWQLAAPPTALVIAMDPEKRWEDEEKRERERSAIHKAIREEVAFPDGATISEDELNFLVNIHVWGEEKYEQANFTDEEMTDALSKIARGRQDGDRGSVAWRQRVLAELADIRANGLKMDALIGKMQLGKPDLATALIPTLLSKCEKELATNSVVTPALKVLLEVCRLVEMLPTGSYVLRPKPKPDETVSSE
jgi:hypothetical protein